MQNFALYKTLLSVNHKIHQTAVFMLPSTKKRDEDDFDYHLGKQVGGEHKKSWDETDSHDSQCGDTDV